MGKGQSKQPSLEGDEKFMEGYVEGAGTISNKRWKRKHGFGGSLHTPDILKLQSDLKLEMLRTKNSGKLDRRKKEYRMSEKWLEQSRLRDATRQEKKGKRKEKLAAAVLVTPDEESVAKAPHRQETSAAPSLSQQTPGVALKDKQIAAPKTLITHSAPLASLAPESPFHPMVTRSKDSSLYPVKDLESYKTKFHPSSEDGASTPEFQCPMVEVANPDRGQDGTGPETMLVYRPWTAEDRTAALKGIPPVEEGVGEFWEAVLELQSSFRLNGREMFQCLRQLFTHKWVRVAGDFTGHAYDGTPLPHDSTALRHSLRQLGERVRERFSRRADYGKISQCRQKEGEEPEDFLDRLRPVFRSNSGIPPDSDEAGVYQQQLKRAFLAGLNPELKRYIDKHWVHQNTGSVQQAIEYAQHAQKAQKQKGEATFAASGDTIAVVYSGPQSRGSYRGRGGRGRGRGRGGRPENSPQYDNKCWNCGKPGHIAKQCRTKRVNNPNSTENDQ